MTGEGWSLVVPSLEVVDIYPNVPYAPACIRMSHPQRTSRSDRTSRSSGTTLVLKYSGRQRSAAGTTRSATGHQRTRRSSGTGLASHGRSCLTIFGKSVEKIEASLKSDNNNRHFT